MQMLVAWLFSNVSRNHSDKLTFIEKLKPHLHFVGEALYIMGEHLYLQVDANNLEYVCKKAKLVFL